MLHSQFNARHRGLGIALLLGLMLCLGCGDASLKPVGVRGRVTFDGQPVPEGIVTLEPTDNKQGRRRDAPLKNGEFVLPPEHGVLPGLEYQVIIQAFRKTGRSFPPGEMGLAFDETEQYLPARYNTATTLRVMIDPNQKQNDLQFDLASAGS